MAYSVYLIKEGKIGSRAEREYIEAERASRQFRRLASNIKDFEFDEDDGVNEEDPDYIGEVSQSAVTPMGCPEPNLLKTEQAYAINNDELDASSAKESLLSRSSSVVSLSRRSSVSSQGAVSVTPRADGRFSFKYKTCSICLTDFESGVKVKVLPNCGHTFHGECLS